MDTNGINSKDIESPAKLSGKESSAETRVPNTNSFCQVQHKVYTRKKASKQVYSTRKYTGPLSESIICRNSGDDYAPDKSVTKGTSIVSKSCHSSDDRPCNRDIFGATATLEGKSNGFPVEETTTNCKPEMSNMPPVLFNKNKKLPTSSVSLESGFQENCHKEKLEHGIIEENGSSASCQNQVTGFCDKNRSITMEVQGSSDVSHYRDVELNSELKDIVNFVGGYFHPLPISSVLLGTKGNEIHVCVSCGLLGHKDRTLFIYKIAIEEPRIGCPSFVGYTSVELPFLEVSFGGMICF